MIDLHVHSTASDGTLTPAQLVKRAKKNGVSVFALTDHDCLDGIPEVLFAAGQDLQVIPGIEISLDVPQGTLHMLGYYVDPARGRLAGVIAELKAARATRNVRMLEKLNVLGVKLTWEQVVAESGGGQVGRIHFARALKKHGWVSTIPDAFDRYLAKGKQAYIKKAILSPPEAIALIREAGGVAVIAHPFSLAMDEGQLRLFIKELVGYGLGGIEVYYPLHKPEQLALYAAVADEFGLIKTGGTDFHGQNKPDVDIGQGLEKLGLKDSVVAELLARRG